jgi:hypothetical protein
MRQLANSDLVARVLQDPLRLLQRIADFQTHARTSSLRSPPTAAALFSPEGPAASAAGLTPVAASFSQSAGGLFASPGPAGSPCFNATPPAPAATGAPFEKAGSSGNGASRKASMRGLEVSDPRQRLSKLTDFLAKKGGLLAGAAGFPCSSGGDSGSSSGDGGAPPSPARAASSSSSSEGGPGTPSRDRLRGALLPTVGRAGAGEVSPPVPAGERLGEVSRLRHANANLEMELHSVKVYADTEAVRRGHLEAKRREREGGVKRERERESARKRGIEREKERERDYHR